MNKTKPIWTRGQRKKIRMRLNKSLESFQITQGIVQNTPQSHRAKKADSPGQNPEQFGLILAGISLAILGTFIFVWYTALKRNL